MVSLPKVRERISNSARSGPVEGGGVRLEFQAMASRCQVTFAAPNAAPTGLFLLLVLTATVAHSFPVSTPSKQSYHVSLPFFIAVSVGGSKASATPKAAQYLLGGIRGPRVSAKRVRAGSKGQAARGGGK